MLLKEFPDLSWIRRQAKNNFTEGRDYRGNKLKHQGWPSVVLNTTSYETERTDIKGPFSLFFNFYGNSWISTENYTLKISRQVFGLTNSGQYYDLLVPATEKVNTFNIHFGQALYNDVIHALQGSHNYLLDNPEWEDFEVNHYPRTHWCSWEFRSRIRRLQEFFKHHQDKVIPSEREEELLADLLEHLMVNDLNIFRRKQKLECLKVSTREELFRRVLLAVDYIHQTFPSACSLQDVSRQVALSKFHLLRTFTNVMGCTPYQYTAKLRSEHASELLLTSNLTLPEISIRTGFSDLASFSRFFKKHSGVSPAAYRKLAI